MPNVNTETFEAAKMKPDPVLVESAAPKRNGIKSSLLLRNFWFFIISQKTNLNNLSVLVIINLTLAGLGFITKVKIANTLGKADFGLFAYGFAIAAYGRVIISFGFERTLARDIIHFPKRQGQLVASSLLLRGLLFVGVNLALVVWKFFSPAVSDLTWGVVLVVLGQSILALELRAVYDSWGKMSRHAIYHLVQRCLYFALVWATILLVPDSFNILWIGVFLIVTFSLYILLQCSWAFKRIEFTGVTKTIVADTISLAKGNLIVWFACLGSLSFGIINQLILKYYGGKEALGGYSAAWLIISIGILLLAQVSRIGCPATARNTKPGVSTQAKVRFLIKYAGVMVFIVSPICLATILWPEFILRQLFKSEFASASNALRMMGIFMMIYPLEIVAAHYMVAIHAEASYFRNVIVGGVLSPLLCFLFIPVMQDVGAVLALILANFTTMALNYYAIIKKLQKSNS